ncbi:hypothetical protein E2320_003122 [Naja naja]|nr:hypothetical protein E2320_003122 [Naja naja]
MWASLSQARTGWEPRQCLGSVGTLTRPPTSSPSLLLPLGDCVPPSHAPLDHGLSESKGQTEEEAQMEPEVDEGASVRVGSLPLPEESEGRARAVNNQYSFV